MSRLILASKSAARITMLRAAGIDVEIMPADIDEAAIKRASGGQPHERLAADLSFQKANAISVHHPDAYVIGSDSLLVVGNQLLSKAADKKEARQKLQTLRGKTHSIISGVSLCVGGKEIAAHVDRADLTMKNFGDDFLEMYMERAGDVLTSCVGAYAIEDLGIRLFEKIEGDFFTVLGMPLLPLIKQLEQQGVIV